MPSTAFLMTHGRASGRLPGDLGKPAAAPGKPVGRPRGAASSSQFGSRLSGQSAVLIAFEGFCCSNRTT
jgi:hypothetical protein